MNYRSLFLMGVIPVALCGYWLRSAVAPRAERPTSSQQRIQERGERSAEPAGERRLQQLERELRALKRNSEIIPLRSAPAPEEAVSVGEAPEALASAPLSGDEAIGDQLDRLNSILLSERLDVAESSQFKDLLGGKLSAAGLHRINLAAVDCYQTVCKVALSFEQRAERDADLSSALGYLHHGAYAYVPSGDSMNAEVYVALPDSDLSRQL